MSLPPLFRLILSVSLAPVMFAGCSAERDARSEEPVELTAGQYRVTMQAGKLGFFFDQGDGPGAVDESICVLPGKTDEFPRNLARQYLAFHSHCSFDWGERQGNAISGKASCPTDAERAPGGMMSTEFQGALATDRVELDGRVKFDLPHSAIAGVPPEQAEQMARTRKLMENVTMRVKAERIGDCT